MAAEVVIPSRSFAVLSQRSAMPSVSKCVATAVTRVTKVCSAVMRRPSSCTRMDPLSSAGVSSGCCVCGGGGVLTEEQHDVVEREDGQVARDLARLNEARVDVAD